MAKERTTNLAFAKQLLRLLSRPFRFNHSRILWLGDSHAVYIRKGLRHQLGQNKPMESLVYWLGPRLMYSISQSGFPTSLFLQKFMIFWKPRIVIVSLGEIDIRMFLHNPNLRDTRWVVDYLFQVAHLCDTLKLHRIYLLTSIPVSNLPSLVPIERVGFIDDRLQGFDWLQSEIKLALSANKSFSKIHFLDIRECLNTSDRTLSPDFTDDGIHVNIKGAWELWGSISNQI